MKKILILLVFSALSISLYAQQIIKMEREIQLILDKWHLAAAHTDFETYFGLMSPSSVFIGTDATEHWNYTAFKAFAKPYFDKGKAWSFTAVERHIYVSVDSSLAWFDELLSTQMKICRGSGVMKKYGNDWKIEQYVLSMTIPNSLSNEVTQLKTKEEDELLKQLSVKENK
ncbi:MAG TPA: nuclear transport factor 2 family protein [Chitinophagaceae bacterium]|nr:nuclear transport factor 2 family protein [Chitinophagaceae bacterium]